MSTHFRRVFTAQLAFCSHTVITLSQRSTNQNKTAHFFDMQMNGQNLIVKFPKVSITTKKIKGARTFQGLNFVIFDFYDLKNCGANIKYVVLCVFYMGPPGRG
jgi:hypothetical protein